MKVQLVGSFARDRQQSMLRFCALLEVELLKAKHSVRVIRPDSRLARIGRPGNGVGKWIGYIDKFVLFPARLRVAAEWADVTHICDQAYGWYTRFLREFPHVVTCHDLIAVRCAQGEFPGLNTRWSGKKYQQMTVQGLRRARHLICDSEATRSDVLRLCKVPASRTSVVFPALNFTYRPAGEKEKIRRLGRFGIEPSERFLLHVGASGWYKNQLGVVRIFERLVASSEARDLCLTMVTDKTTRDVKTLLGKYGLQSRTRMLSDVECEDLRALYSGATALIFPSLCEGFGWPIIEAQACGCPVFTSDRAPMTELGGEGAVYIDPENPRAAAEKILESLPYPSRMRVAGLANVRRFSPDKMVAGYVSSYAEAIRTGSGGCWGEVT